mmetsp:Transcript_42728/g.67621  ORF Transcript_42728/g.67621 Transcript_42728/m.67621 type:complete len:388 (-) Transcript_42728:55-1218(-)
MSSLKASLVDLIACLTITAAYSNHAAHSSSSRNSTSCSLLQVRSSGAPEAVRISDVEGSLAYWDASPEEIQDFVAEELPELRHLTKAKVKVGQEMGLAAFDDPLLVACDAPMSYSNTEKAKRWYSEEKLKQLFGDLNLLPRTDLGDSGEPFPRYDQCAVVSSSGRILKHSHGTNIDAHDFVIRFNVAPVKGFEKHVGGKTSMRLVNPHVQIPRHDIWTYGPSDSPLPAMLNASYPLLGEQSLQVLQATPGYISQDVVDAFLSIRRTHPEIKYHMQSQTLYTFMKEAFGLNNPTAGMVGVFIALQICKNVDVYELLPSNATIERYHYWEDRGVIFCPHDCKKEHGFLQKHNLLNESETTGVARLSAWVHPELRYCLQKPPSVTMPIDR